MVVVVVMILDGGWLCRIPILLLKSFQLKSLLSTSYRQSFSFDLFTLENWKGKWEFSGQDFSLCSAAVHCINLDAVSFKWLQVDFSIEFIFPNLSEQEEGEEEEDDGEHDDAHDDDDDAILEEDEDEVDGSGNESGSEGSEYDKHGKADGEPKFICQECQQNAVQNQRDNLMTKWLKNNFDPR